MIMNIINNLTSQNLILINKKINLILKILSVNNSTPVNHDPLIYAYHMVRSRRKCAHYALESLMSVIFLR